MMPIPSQVRQFMGQRESGLLASPRVYVQRTTCIRRGTILFTMHTADSVTDCCVKGDPIPLFGPGIDTYLWLVDGILVLYTRGSSAGGGDASLVESSRPGVADRHA